MTIHTARARSTLVRSHEVNKVLSSTFVVVAGMWLLTAVAGFGTLNWRPHLAEMLVMFVLSIGLIFATRACRQSGWGLVTLGAFSCVQGAMLGPILNHYLAMRHGVEVVSLSALLTAGATFGCALYAMTTGRDFSRWSGFLVGGLVMLILVSLVGLCFPVPGLSLGIAFISAALFLCWTLYDIGAILNGQETNYISAALGLYLDMLNFFMDMLRIVSAFSGNED